MLIATSLTSKRNPRVQNSQISRKGIDSYSLTLDYRTAVRLPCDGVVTGAMEYLRSALNTLKSTVNAIRDLPPKGFLATLRDGNLMETALHSRGATLVGIDKFGNKYYEKLNAQHGRHRWVDYADLNNYDASSVPPEWHGWLHYITDRKPEQLEELKPVRYGIEHKPNVSGLGDLHAYHSKGHAKNPQQRDWTRYEPWTSS